MGKVFAAKMLATATVILLTLATLCNVTQIGLALFLSNNLGYLW